MSKSVCVKDLPMKAPPGVFLLCGECDSQFSADAGDYFLVNKDHILTHCGENMRLVMKVVTFVDYAVNRIVLKDNGRILIKHTGTAYAMPNVGLKYAERGVIVSPGDYVNEDGEYRSAHWVGTHPTEWDWV